MDFDSNIDFSGRFLKNVVFERCTFNKTPLDGVNFSAVEFRGCHFTDCNLAKAEIFDSVFDSCRFESCEFLRTMFNRCTFSNGIFEKCVFFAKSWFIGTATDTTFAGSGEIPRHRDELVETNVVWQLDPKPRPTAPVYDNIVQTLSTAVVEDYDRMPTTVDAPGAIVSVTDEYFRSGCPTTEIAENFTDYELLSLVARFTQLCGLALTHNSPLHLSAAIMTYNFGARKDDRRHHYRRFAAYVYSEKRLSEAGLTLPYPIPEDCQFGLDLPQFLALTPENQKLHHFGAQVVETNGEIRFRPLER